ncbi:MAG: type II toxin-antitoxin system VapC family toxin [Ardenticatenaceae bacterium]|nr:type II toxin-antitoxin system VapC family toxin [Ardenticatenaceae bacterium]HBY96165.1 hypothetical protein [Chloroflexota bacterium]
MATVDLPRICLDTGPLPITAYELLCRAACTRRRLDEQDLPGIMVVLPFDVSGAQRAAQLHAELIGRNQDIGVKDVLTAAICLEHRLPLLTTNVRHFERVLSLPFFSIEEFVQEESG